MLNCAEITLDMHRMNAETMLTQNASIDPVHMSPYHGLHALRVVSCVLLQPMLHHASLRHAWEHCPMPSEVQGEMVDCCPQSEGGPGLDPFRRVVSVSHA